MAAATTTSSVDSQIEIFVQEVLVKEMFTFSYFRLHSREQETWIPNWIKNCDSPFVYFRMYRAWRKRSIVSLSIMKTLKMSARSISANKWVSDRLGSLRIKLKNEPFIWIFSRIIQQLDGWTKGKCPAIISIDNCEWIRWTQSEVFAGNCATHGRRQYPASEVRLLFEFSLL